jgi:hypothetical protein
VRIVGKATTIAIQIHARGLAQRPSGILRGAPAGRVSVAVKVRKAIRKQPTTAVAGMSRIIDISDGTVTFWRTLGMYFPA